MIRGRFGIHSLSLFVLSLPLVLLTGCTLATTAPDAPIPGAALQGKVFGGNQPVVGAHVYLMAATVSGIGSAGYGLASTSLLTGTGTSDTIGSYVLTGSTGMFALDSVPGTNTPYYTCPSSSTQVYLYALGGNPGSGANTADGFMAALGSCGSLSSSTSVWMNEVTTVAAAYSLAGFATDALHVSIPQYSVGTTADTLAQTDLQNAFAGVNNLVNSTTGGALSTTPGTNGTPTTAQVITLANILAACVNASTAVPANCTTLLGNAGSTGGATGTIPTDTATAAINIAHYPYVSSAVMTNLYALQAASGAPFANGDSSQPNDFTISITYTGGGINTPYSIAIDASGNAWVANRNSSSSVSKFSNSGVAVTTPTASPFTGGGLSYSDSVAIDASGNAWVANVGNNSISKFSSTGTAISGSSGYTGGGLNNPVSVAIDATGNVWAANAYPGSVLCKFSSSGVAVTTPTASPFTGGGINDPTSVAIDASGNAWLADLNNNSISKFSSTGTAISGNSGYTGGGLNSPISVAIDASGNAWVANELGASLSKFSSTGSVISTSAYTGGGLDIPVSIAIDGSGNAWVANESSASISKFSSTGSAISPSSTGYTTSSGFSNPNFIAIDGSGNVWVANQTGNSLTEFIGAATPVVTPVVANLITPYTAPASKP